MTTGYFAHLQAMESKNDTALLASFDRIVSNEETQYTVVIPYLNDGLLQRNLYFLESPFHDS